MEKEFAELLSFYREQVFLLRIAVRDDINGNALQQDFEKVTATRIMIQNLVIVLNFTKVVVVEN